MGSEMCIRDRERAKKFLEIEQKAGELVNTLEKMIESAGSYKSARDELDRVREESITLIQSTNEASLTNQEIIARLREIDATEMIVKIKRLDERFYEKNQELIELIKNIDADEILNSIDEKSKAILSRQVEIDNRVAKMNENLKDHHLKNKSSIGALEKQMNLLKILVFVSIGVSVVAIIVGAIT